MLWSEIKSCITATAEELCRIHVPKKWQQWITEEIMCKIEERRHCRGDKHENGIRKYTHLIHEIQKLCGQKKND